MCKEVIPPSYEISEVTKDNTLYIQFSEEIDTSSSSEDIVIKGNYKLDIQGVSTFNSTF